MSTLKVYHRVVGDPPSRGFDDALISPNFPVNAALAGIRSARIPMSGVPGQSQAGSSAGLSEQHRVFEVQALPFGQVMVIHSAVGAIAGSRAHAYSDFALPMPEDEAKPVLTSYLSAAQLLRFDDFLSLEWFWGLDKTSKTLPVHDWDPPRNAGFSYDAPMSDAFLDALLAAYWRGMSQRAFAGKTIPLRLCLGNQSDQQTIIAQAKALLVDKILRYLPRAVENILSMSAPVSNQQIMQKFPDSALVVVYPEAQVKYEFDLRSQQVNVHADQDELAFIQHIRQGGKLPLLAEMVSVYQALYGGDKDSCPLMADYAFALAGFRAERGLLSPGETIPLWKELYERLAGLHYGIQASEHVDAIMLPMTVHLMDWLAGEMDTMSSREKEAMVPNREEILFATRKALTLAGVAQKAVMQVLAGLQALRMQPFITELLLDKDIRELTKNEAAALLLNTVLETGFLDAFPDEKQRSALTEDAFVKLVKEEGRERLYQCLASYAVRLSGRHPDKDLLTLPLAVYYPSRPEEGLEARYSSPRDALKHAGKVLKRKHINILPDAEQVAGLKRALYGAEEAAVRDFNSAFDEYLADSYYAHPENPRAVFDLAASLGDQNKENNNEAALDMVFQKAAQRQRGARRAGLSWEQIQDLQQGFLRGKPMSTATRESLEAYVDTCVREAGPWMAFQYLADCPLPENHFSTERLIPRRGIGHVLASMKKEKRLPDHQQFEKFMDWCRQTDYEPGMMARVIEAYEGAREYAGPDEQSSWVTQVKELTEFLRLDGSVPAMQEVAKETIRETFINELRKTGFDNAVHLIQDQGLLRKAGLQHTDVLKNEGVREALAKRLEEEFSKPASLAQFKELACQFEEKRYDEAYSQYWKKALSDSLHQKKKAIFLGDTCRKLGDIKELGDFVREKSTQPIDDEWFKLPLEISADIDRVLQDTTGQGNLREKLKQYLKRLLDLEGGVNGQAANKVKRLICDYWKSRGDEVADRLSFTEQTGLALFCYLDGKDRFNAQKLLQSMAPINHVEDVPHKDPYSSPEGLSFLSTVTALFDSLAMYSEGYSSYLAKSLRGDGAQDFDDDKLRQLNNCRSLLTGNRKNYDRFIPKPIRSAGLKEWLGEF